MAELTTEEQDFVTIVNGLYTERNLVVQAFARSAQALGWNMGVKFDPAHPDWPVLVIDTPSGQCAWHLAKHDLLGKWPHYQGDWDGHTTEEKYQRVKRYIGSHRPALETDGYVRANSPQVPTGPAHEADTQQ